MYLGGSGICGLVCVNATQFQYQAEVHPPGRAKCYSLPLRLKLSLLPRDILPTQSRPSQAQSQEQMPTGILEEEEQVLLSTIEEIKSKLTKCNDWAEQVNLRGRLGEAWKRAAEVKEEQRVQETIEKAVTTGLVETPVVIDDVGECPLCLEEIPKTVPSTLCLKRGDLYQRLLCCGTVICVKCTDHRHRKTTGHTVPFPEAPGVFLSFESETEVPEGTGTVDLKTCPFCRSPNHGEEHLVSLVRRNAEAGKSWAQCALGQTMVDGSYGVKIDHWKAKEWLEPAAEAGDFNAMHYLSRLWEMGFPEACVSPNLKKAKKYLLRAARKGSGVAQYKFALTGSDKEAGIWMTLSAAQGFVLAQRDLGNNFRQYCIPGNKRTPTSVGFDPMIQNRVLYWLKKASLQGEMEAQKNYVFGLLNTRASTLGGLVDAVGYSAIPEALFWCELMTDEMKNSFCDAVGAKLVQRDSVNPMKILNQCACCRKPSGNGCAIQLCSKCKGIGYCGRECQTRHWKMGHKRDCKVVEDCRKALTLPSAVGYQYPVVVTPA
jgi:MYND finger/Sel1 repeat